MAAFSSFIASSSGRGHAATGDQKKALGGQSRNPLTADIQTNGLVGVNESLEIGRSVESLNKLDRAFFVVPPADHRIPLTRKHDCVPPSASGLGSVLRLSGVVGRHDLQRFRITHVTALSGV